MRVMQYYPIDMVNGPGTRVTLFVSGCAHRCKGCYNAATWNPKNGVTYTQEMEDKIIADLNDPRINKQGLSLTGGDPLLLLNLSDILGLVKRVRKECPDKDIWLWTGYTYEDLSPEQQAVVDLVDVVVDGKFVAEKKDSNLIYCGSSNQRVIAVAKK